MNEPNRDDPSVSRPSDTSDTPLTDPRFAGSKGTRTGNIYLIGYRGTGKTTVARLLAQRLVRPFVEMDEVIETRHGRTIHNIFEDHGEAEFRRLESNLLRELSESQPSVVATGGGIILDPTNREFLGKSEKTVWLTADAQTLWARVRQDPSTINRRPNLAQGGLAEIEELLHLREPFYQECADCTVDTTERSPEEVVSAILADLAR